MEPQAQEFCYCNPGTANSRPKGAAGPQCCSGIRVGAGLAPRPGLAQSSQRPARAAMANALKYVRQRAADELNRLSA